MDIFLFIQVIFYLFCVPFLESLFQKWFWECIKDAHDAYLLFVLWKYHKWEDISDPRGALGLHASLQSMTWWCFQVAG